MKWLKSLFSSKEILSDIHRDQIANDINLKYNQNNILDNLNIGIYRTSPSNKILFANQYFIKMLEYESLNELKQKEHEKALLNKIWNRSVFNDAIVKKGKVTDLISEWTTKNGNIITVKENACAVYNQHGEVVYYEGTAEDISLKKKKELDIEQNENRLNNAQKMAKIGSWSYNYINDNFFWSKEAYALFGYSENEISPTYGFFINHIYNKDKPYFFSTLENHLIKKGLFDIELRFKKKDGTLFYAHAIGKTYYNPSGEIVQFEGTFQDITERKEIEELLRNSLEKLALHIENTPLAYIEWNANMEVINWNQAAENIFGYSKFEARGKHASDLIVDKKNKNKLLENAEKLLNNNGGIHYKMDNVRKNGENLICEWYNTPIANKNSSGIISMILDITEKTQAEKQLIEAKNKAEKYQQNFLFLSETALDFLRITKIEDFYKYIAKKLYNIDINAKFIIFFAYNSLEKQLEVKHVEGSEKIIARLKKIIGINPLNLTYRPNKQEIQSLQSGKLQLYKFSNFKEIIPGIDINFFKILGKIYKANNFKYIGIARDEAIYGSVCFLSKENLSELTINLIESITHQSSVAFHRLSIEKELIIAKNKAQESDKLKSAFLANMSHEIRTPMNGILGFAELLTNPGLNAEKKELYIKVINENSKYLLSLVNDIVDISKIQANQLKISKINFCINKLMDEIYEFFSLDLIAKKRTEVTLNLQCGLPYGKCEVYADQLRIQQVLNNLLSNAIKFTHKGSIDFGFDIKNGNILFYVKDSGIGLAQHKIDFIFERFTQADHSTTRKYGGTGLGLAICKGLVELMQGKIWVESKEEEGSNFYFTVPFVTDIIIKEKPKASPGIVPVTNKQLKRKTILIVEDDVISYTYLKEIVEVYDINVIHAWDGEEAIEFCRKNPNIHLVLMDIHLPKINGYEATKKILRLNNDIPIVAQTANAMLEDKQKCLDIGCVDYLAKPVDKDDLIQCVKLHINNKKKETV